MVSEKEKVYGHIYKATNTINGKVYIGQTKISRWGENQVPVEGRWNEETKKAEKIQERREVNPNKNNRGRYIENAIINYGHETFKVEKIDSAHNLKDLNKKEKFWVQYYDSTNPDKGYNVTEGGNGKIMRPEIKEHIRKKVRELHKKPEFKLKQKEGLEKKWNEKEFRKKMEKSRRSTEYREKMRRISRNKLKDPKFQERMEKIRNSPEYKESRRKMRESTKYKENRIKMRKNPEYHKTMKKAAEKRSETPGFSEKMSKSIEKKWKEHEYREKQKITKNSPEYKEKMKRIRESPEFKEKMKKIRESPEFKEKQKKAAERKWKRPEYVQKHKDSMEKFRKKIDNIKDFLTDIKNRIPMKNMVLKYEMSNKTIKRNIKELFGHDGPKNYTEAKEYLKDKEIDNVLKNIEKRNTEKQDEKQISETESEDSEKEPSEEREEEGKNKESSEEDGKESTEEETENSSEDIINKPLEEEKKESEEKSSEEESEDSQDQPIEEPPNKTDKQQDNPPENQSIESPETTSKEEIFETSYPPGKGDIQGLIGERMREIDKEEAKRKSQEGTGFIDYPNFPIYIDDLVRGDWERSESPFEKSTKDYDGVDKSSVDSPSDKHNDYEGIDKFSEKEDKDFKGLNEESKEEVKEFDGIDEPSSEGNKDYDHIDKDYGGEHGGEA